MSIFFTAHIFFDDAFEISDVCDDWMQVNQFVRTFVASVDEAASYVHQTNIRLRPPQKVSLLSTNIVLYILTHISKYEPHVHVLSLPVRMLFIHLLGPDSIRGKTCLQLAGQDEIGCASQGQVKDQAQETLVAVHVHVLLARPPPHGTALLSRSQGSVGGEYLHPHPGRRHRFSTAGSFSTRRSDEEE